MGRAAAEMSSAGSCNGNARGSREPGKAQIVVEAYKEELLGWESLVSDPAGLILARGAVNMDET